MDGERNENEYTNDLFLNIRLRGFMKLGSITLLRKVLFINQLNSIYLYPSMVIKKRVIHIFKIKYKLG